MSELGDAVDLMIEAQTLAEETFRCSLTWAGEEYPCSGGPEEGGKRIDEGGFRLNARVKIKVRCALFPAEVGFPREKQTISYKRSTASAAKTYRIDSITNFYDAVLQLECNDPNEGA